MFLYGSTVKILFITLCWFRFVIALLAEDALWYLTMAVVKLLPKLSCSMRHFYRAPSVEKSLYKSSFVKSGCRPMTFKVRISFWTVSGALLSCDGLRGTLEILLLTFSPLWILFRYSGLLPWLLFLSLMGPLFYLSLFYLNLGAPPRLLSSLWIPLLLSVGPRPAGLNFLLPLSAPLGC